MSEPMTEDDLAAIEGMLSAGAIEVRYGREYDPSIVRALVAEVRRLREERRGMVAESSWDELADELTEVEADNARFRAAIREHDRRYTLDGGGRARCYPVMGELLPGDDDD